MRSFPQAGKEVKGKKAEGTVFLGICIGCVHSLSRVYCLG